MSDTAPIWYCEGKNYHRTTVCCLGTLESEFLKNIKWKIKKSSIKRTEEKCKTLSRYNSLNN